MNYKDLKSYKILIELGCVDTTGPQMLKKGIVKLSPPSKGYTYSQVYYHFDPNFVDAGTQKTYAKAARKQAAASTEFLFKTPGENDYDLAFSSFILHMFNVRKIEISSEEMFLELVDKNKEKIFYKLFGDK